MEVYKRKVGYEDLNYRIVDISLPVSASSYLITATTLYFPFMLTQNFEDMGIYTDVQNTAYEVVDFSGFWNLSNSGTNQKTCLVLNNCKVSFNSVPITFYGANNGSIIASITNCPGPQTVTWTGPNNFTSSNLTINNLVSGNYTAKVTDANCNITYTNYFLTQPQSLSFSLKSISSKTNATTPSGCDGSVSITPQGGLPPYTYLWYSGNTSNVLPGTTSSTTGVTNLCAGTYNVRITDSASPPTMVSGLFVITEPTPISGSVITKTNIACFGSNTGSITFSAEGGIHPNGYKYVLSGPTSATITGSTGSVTFNNLPTGSYICTIYDEVGNLTTVPVSLTSSSAVVSTVSSTNVNCYGNEDGSITVTASGGVTPYNINVNGNSLTNPTENIFSRTYNSNSVVINNLATGTYTIKSTDTNSCSSTNQVVVIKQKARLDINRISPVSNFNGFDLPCYGSTTGITFQTSYYTDASTLSPTSQPIAYYLDSVFIPPIATGLVTSNNITIGSGTHTVTAVNTVTNCSASTTVTLTQPSMSLSFVGTPDIDKIFIPSASCTPVCSSPGYGGSCVQAIVNVNGGVAPYTIVWLMDGITPWGSGITSDPFCETNPYSSLSCTVTDSNGCTITSSITV